MSRIEAIVAIVHDSHHQKCTDASAKRMLQACKVLDLSDADQRRLFHVLQYCDASGKSYGTKQVWP